MVESQRAHVVHAIVVRHSDDNAQREEHEHAARDTMAMRRVGGGESGYRRPTSAKRMRPGDGSAGPTHDAKFPQTLPPSYTSRQAMKRAVAAAAQDEASTSSAAPDNAAADATPDAAATRGSIGGTSSTSPNARPSRGGMVETIETALFLGGASGSVYAFNLATDQIMELEGGGHRGPCESLCAIRSMELVASGGGDANVIIWSCAGTGFERVRTLRGHSKAVTCMAYSHAHQLLLSTGFDHDVLIWNPYFESPIYRLSGHRSCVVCAQFALYAPEIVTVSADGIIKVWDLQRSVCVQTLRNPKPRRTRTSGEVRVSGAALSDSPESCHIVVVTADRVRTYDSSNANSASVSKRGLGLASSEGTKDTFDPVAADVYEVTCVLYHEATGTFLTASGNRIKVCGD